MGPAEIVASLKELCEEKGPRIVTEEIVDWIEAIGGYESDVELIQYAKKMKARHFARMLEYDDPDVGRKIKRLWSFRDRRRGRRFYTDILQVSDERRQRLVQEYIKFAGQMKSVRKAMADSMAGQVFFEFYGDDEDEEAVEEAAATEA
ncbi:hypothetical protein [Planctomyces sp. SH-PL62]|uniref:hypothetical protein n=1 Tax=Planctomyces sp. SH-PL62 TaxID=1636152 RepID=UPI00078E422D|nr:hypothetical protein [Planctomyces sp. SH-PL62]AMV36283.1 hypothetical protein VT85_02485 [Planctomyces sp. SH-PL62]